MSRKVSYVARLPEWQWVVGAGFFLDTLDAAIAMERQRLQDDLLVDTWKLLLISLLAISASALVVRWGAGRLRENIAVFNRFFERVASRSEKMERKQILFCEFDPMAEAINRMVDERDRIESDRKQLEAQLLQSQKLEAIGTLAGGIAHDFNNLLASICGNLTLLGMKTAADSPQRKYLERLNDSADKARDLVGQILSFSRSSQGQSELLDLGAVMQESIALLRASIPRSVEIELELDEQPCLAWIDKTQLHQVLMNLCNNAWHALPSRGGQIRVALRQLCSSDIPAFAGQLEGAPAALARISVQDNGSCIAPEDLGRIFDPFFSTKEQGKGTGLGLSIVQRIVRQYGGLVDVESSVGEGTCFQIFLPLATGESAAAVDEEQPVVRGEGKILLVDDEEAILEATGDFLQQLGYQVERFSSPRAAVAHLEASDADYRVIITDQTMPEMSGLELVDKIRSLRSQQSIILCTGFSEQVDEQKAASLGLSHFLMKPISLPRLSRLLQQL